MSDANLIAAYELFKKGFEDKGFTVGATSEGIYIDGLAGSIKLQTVQEMDTYFAGVCTGLRMKEEDL